MTGWWIIPAVICDLGKWLAVAIIAAATALGLYAKGLADARAKKAAKDAAQTVKQLEVRNEVDDDSRRGDARDRLRYDWRE